MRRVSVWTILLALLGTHMAGMGAFLTLPVLASAIAAETGLPAALAGVHTALTYGGVLLASPFIQPLLAALGGIRACQAGLLVIAGGLAVATLGSPAALLASALLCGVGHAPLTPAGSHLLHGRTPPGRRSLIFGIKQCGVPAGAMLIAALAPALSLLFGWRGAVLAIAGLAVLLAVLLQPLRAALDGGLTPPQPRRALVEAVRSLALLARPGPIRALAIASSSFGVAQFCFSSFFVVWQVEVLEIGLAQAGLHLALAQAAGVAGRIGWAMLADRVGARPVLVGLGSAMAAGCLALAAAGPGWPVAVVVLTGIAMGASAIAWNGVLLAEVARLAPAGQVGGATAALGFAFSATMVAMPTAFSLLVATTGSYAPGFLMCALAAAAGLAALSASARERRGAAPPPPPA
ncbi:MAG: MFS transporter [Rhodovarius sp.]|nr:MFS transporter [Rhodovarius sp.]